MVYGKIGKGLPPLNISKLSRGAKEKEYEKKIYDTNKWWID